MGFGGHKLIVSRTLLWDLSILVQTGQTLQSSFPDLPKGLEEKGLKKMARAFLRGAQWPCPGICLSPAPSGVQEVSSENELLN